jgi:chromosome segregation protein
VDEKIKEANLVIGEKNAFLAELGKEKETAITYMDAKKKFNNAKGTLLKKEIEKLKKELGSNQEKTAKLNEEIKRRESESTEAEEKIRQIEAMRSEISRDLQLKQQTSGLIKKIEELKAAITSRGQMISDRENSIKRIDEEDSKNKKEMERDKHELSALEKEMESMKKELGTFESEMARHASSQKTSELEILAKNIDSTVEKEREISDRLLRMESEINSKKEISTAKMQEIETLAASLGIKSEEDEGLEKEKAKMKGQLATIVKELEDMFSEEKSLNERSAELDKKLLELREKHSMMRVQASPSLANPALRYVGELKAKGELDGIYGTLAELIKFDAKYTSAVEAAAGSRLTYVVVKDADTATKVIKLLKKTGNGRATFIPLKEIRATEAPVKGPQIISSVLSYSNEVKKAIDYAFGETLLMDSVEDAKKFGIGNARMVTLEGEIFERSGVISGGKVQNSILAATQINKIEQEINDIKEEKAGIMRELVASRESASKIRAEKSETELKIKTLEIEEKTEKELLAANEKSVQRKKALEEEIKSIEKMIKERSSEYSKLQEESALLKKKLSELNESLDKMEEKSKEEADESTRKKTELTARISSLRATVEGKRRELEIRKNTLFRKEEQLKMNEKERKDLVDGINELKKSINAEQEELSKNEEKVSSTSRQIERLFERMKEHETDLQKLGEMRGKLRLEMDKFNKDMNQLEVKRAIADTRLLDINAEFAGYKEFEELELKSDELQEIVKGAEEIISSLVNVNMAAIEMFDKKKMEIEELQKSITTLDGERRSVLQMIEEIDTRKKDAFFEVFDAVSDNFRKMFKYIKVGEGFLYLDKPAEPFESGLHIKLKRANHEHSIESLSGGESSLVALMFIFSLQFVKPSPFYILDEIDSALDKENSKNLAQLLQSMSENSQFIVVSHNDYVMALADAILGVTRVDGVSKLVGVKLEQAKAVTSA